MRASLLLVALSGCIIDVHRHHDEPGDDAVVDDTGRHGETGHVPATCDARVRRAFASLASARSKGCGHAWVVSSVEVDGGEVTLQLFVDTLGGADRPTEPYQVGQTFTADLATVSPSAAFARVLVGAGQFESACNDVADPSASVDHAWLGSSGTATIVVTGAGELTEWGEARFDADVTLRGVVVEDQDGGRCVVPDMTLTGISLGWMAG